LLSNLFCLIDATSNDPSTALGAGGAGCCAAACAATATSKIEIAACLMLF